MKPQVDMFSFVFLEEIEDTKKTFQNYLTFSYFKEVMHFYETLLKFPWTGSDLNAVVCEMRCFLYMFSLFSTILIKF